MTIQRFTSRQQVEDALATGDPTRLEWADLSGLNLEDLVFEDMELRNTCFRGADLARSFFNRSRLELADFGSADLTDSTFDGCGADGADFQEAGLDGALFDRCRMIKASFNRAQGLGVRFHETDISHSRLDGAVLPELDLDTVAASRAQFLDVWMPRLRVSRGCDLSFANFDTATAVGAVLAGDEDHPITMKDAALDGANFSHSRFTHVNASSTEFRDGLFRGTTFNNCCLDEADMAGGNYVGSSICACTLRRSEYRADTFVGAALIGVIE